jgi:nicotinamide riboside kinase
MDFSYKNFPKSAAAIDPEYEPNNVSDPENEHDNIPNYVPYLKNEPNHVSDPVSENNPNYVFELEPNPSPDKVNVKYFTVYGERCSGTNFLTSAIQENFNLKFTSKYTWKHFFGHYKFKNNEEEDNTLFIGIVRNPITWIDSFYKKPHHVPNENTVNIRTFIYNKFYSIYEDEYNKEIMEDRNILTNERYNNIFELRYVKNNYLIKEMKKNVKNYLLIRYEDLRDNYNSVLEFLEKKFHLERKYKEFKTIDTYKGYKGANIKLFFKKNILLKKNIINIIKKELNNEQEKELGYFLSN